jgi:hypothetical protein
MDRLLKIMQQRAALLGLNVQKLALTDPSGAAERTPAVQLVNVDWSALKAPLHKTDPIEELIAETARGGLPGAAGSAREPNDSAETQSPEGAASS